jgi:hypothetical protein
MAKYVGYFENFETPEEETEAFSEGPFVVVNAGGHRIEVQFKGNKCPALPMPDIYSLCELHGKTCHKGDDEKIIATVDWLNEQVKAGIIICHEKGYWYVK